MFNSTPVDTWQCDGWSTKGTPYLIDGCDNQEVPSEKCRRCMDRGGFCDQETTYYVDGSVFTQNVTCKYKLYSIGKKSSKTSLGVILGVSISMGVLFLVENAIFVLLFTFSSGIIEIHLAFSDMDVFSNDNLSQ
ncbi:hypothetical protein L1987_37303 [Smallanthus sonchifolius]|uniref:Uncharacterized protein n=1 Tax=Smallanthus sonchifolius TaxID=185202 RepID=A0ACB9HFZ2_9ASTR|nr:hypothetical protein L1987_37303 [Smallanthus sonchifolius]